MAGAEDGGHVSPQNCGDTFSLDYFKNSCHASLLDSGGLLLRDAEPPDLAAPGRGPGRGQARQQGRRGLQAVQHLHGEHLGSRTFVVIADTVCPLVLVESGYYRFHI